jgi:hypothetical protein
MSALRFRADRRHRLAEFDSHTLSSLMLCRNQGSDFEYLIADDNGLGLTVNGYERCPQHAGADVAIPDVNLAFIECAAAHGKGLALEVFTNRTVSWHKTDSALAREPRSEMDGDVDDFAWVIHILARLDIDSFDLHTGAGVRAGGCPTLRRMSVFYVCKAARAPELARRGRERHVETRRRI